MAVKSVTSVLQDTILTKRRVYHARASLDLIAKNAQMEAARYVKTLSLLVLGNALTVGLSKGVDLANADSLVVPNVRMDIT